MIPRRYGLKRGYKIGKKQRFTSSMVGDFVNRKKNYNFVEYISNRANITRLIFIGSSNIELIRDITNLFDVTVIDHKHNLALLKDDLPKAEVIGHNLERGLPQLSEDLLNKSVVIFFDTLQNLYNPNNLLRDLSNFAEKAPYLLISCLDRTISRGPEDFGPPKDEVHVREWSIDEMFLLLKNYNFDCLIGHVASQKNLHTKDTILAISGKEVIPTPLAQLSPVKVLAIVIAYNEEDIIKHSIEHLLKQGIDVHLVDNWSTDTTYSQAEQLSKQYDNLTYERFPKKKPKIHKYEWGRLLGRVEEIAEASKHDWIIHNDADEFRDSPWKHLSMKEAIIVVNDLGYNVIDFTVLDFRPTKDGYDGSVSPEDFFLDFDPLAHPSYLDQIKCWKNVGRVNLSDSGGHHVVFDNQKIFPLKFLSKHYPLRSKTQASKKIFKERKPNFLSSEREKGWHTQYDTYKETERFIWSKDELVEFNEGTFYSEFIMERLSGIGIDQ
jgi:glycosyltransferase involved in cell wall biosynthesis